MIRFFCGGTPKSMKVSGVAPFMRGGKQHYAPKRGNDEWVAVVGKIGRDHAPATPLVGGLAFTAIFWLARPSTAKKGVTLPLKRPDLDNLTHKLTDQWNGIFWLDDSQIVDVHQYKRFTTDGRTGVEICVEPVHLPEITVPQQSALLHAPA